MTDARPKRRTISITRAVIAAIVTGLLVIALELVSITRPAGPLVQAGYFLVPGIVAALFYRGWVERAIAFVLLTIFGFVAAALVIAIFLG